MVSSDAILATVSLLSIGCLGWAVQLSSRLSVVETEYEGLKELINSQFAGTNQRLERIERSMNGRLGR